MDITDLFRQANSTAGGFNASLARLADSVVGNPVAKAANTFGADIDANPLLRLLHDAGLGVRDENYGTAYDVGNVAGEFAGGMVPGAGDVDGIKQAQEAVDQEGWNTRTSLYAALAALGLLPAVPNLVRYAQDKLPGGHAPRVGDRFGANERGQIGDLTKDRAKLLPPEERGRWHPIGLDKKMRKPIEEMSRVVSEQHGLLPDRVRTPEEMQGGMLMAAPADRTEGGRSLLAVGDIELARPVEMGGGFQYKQRMPDPSEAAADHPVWASNWNAVKKLVNQYNRAIPEGTPAYLTYVPGGHNQVNFTTQMSDAILEQLNGSDVSKTAKKIFDRELRKRRPEWTGLDSEDAIAQLHANGELRHKFNEVADLAEFQKRGFPDLAETRFALTHPDLLHVPLYKGGQGISRISGKVVDSPVGRHSTYDTQLGGEYFGRLEDAVPRDVLFPDFFKERRATNRPLDGDNGAWNRSSPPVQPADQQWVDNIMTYLEAQKPR